jgi:hypothetical protein
MHELKRDFCRLLEKLIWKWNSIHTKTIFFFENPDPGVWKMTIRKHKPLLLSVFCLPLGNLVTSGRRSVARYSDHGCHDMYMAAPPYKPKWTLTSVLRCAVGVAFNTVTRSWLHGTCLQRASTPVFWMGHTTPIGSELVFVVEVLHGTMTGVQNIYYLHFIKKGA